MSTFMIITKTLAAIWLIYSFITLSVIFYQLIWGKR